MHEPSGRGGVSVRGLPWVTSQAETITGIVIQAIVYLLNVAGLGSIANLIMSAASAPAVIAGALAGIVTGMSGGNDIVKKAIGGGSRAGRRTA